MTRVSWLSLAAVALVPVLASLASCGREPSAGARAPGTGSRPRAGLAEAAPLAADRVAAGQTIYVPAYSSVLTADRASRFNLAVTLSVRNTDPAHPIVLNSVRYYDEDGRPVRDELKAPLRVGPMAAAEFFVTEGDTRGGVSASFLVEWVAERRVSPPVVESVMVGTASTQGVSFVCPGRVLADRAPGLPARN
jgi:hypothetical protein